MNLFLQFFHFIGISGCGWLLDFTIFNLLHIVIENSAICNWISSFVAITFVFIVSTRKTFIQKSGSINLKVKFIIYVLYQVILVALMSLLLFHIDEMLNAFLKESPYQRFSAMAAKITVTPVTMILNFFVMKFLIEKL